jgi:hypothetical protein
MAITKETKISSIEVVGEFKNINVKKIISIKEDGNVISTSNFRTSYSNDTDISTLDSDVAAVANIFWTDEIKAAYTATLPVYED